MSTKNLLLLPFLVLLLMGCHHKDDITPEETPTPVSNYCGQTEHNEIDNSLMQQFLFKAGTYWVYKDSVENSTDSCFCYGGTTKSGSITYGGGMGVPPCVVKFRYASDSINLNSTFRYVYYIQGNFLRIVAPFGFPSVLLFSNNSGTLTGSDSLTVYYPSITINSTAYNNVYRFHFKTLYGPYREGYYYMKSGLGIIKLDLLTSETPAVRKVYELERYHIE